MRICIVARVVPAHAIGGMQDHTLDLARGLAAAGHDVDVVTARHPEGREFEEAFGARWHYVDAPFDDFAHPAWRARSYEAFARLGAGTPFDVVHGEGSSALELVRRGTHRATPIVNMFHGNFVGLVEASLRRQLRARRPLAVLREQRGLLTLARRHFAKGNWRVFRACESIIPSRQQLVGTCRSHLLDSARVHVVENGVDTSRFRPLPREELRSRLGLPGGFLFVCAGRLNREKGFHHALQALARADGGMPDAKLLVVGEGAARPGLERLAETLGIADRVVFAGAQPPARMPAYLAAADVFLFPTERDEAAPLVLPQAMACGLPVVASRVGGIPEVIDAPGDNGLLVAPADVGALIGAMTSVHGDVELRRRLAAAGLARVEAAYTLERMVERTCAVYELALRRGLPG